MRPGTRPPTADEGAILAGGRETRSTLPHQEEEEKPKRAPTPKVVQDALDAREEGRMDINDERDLPGETVEEVTASFDLHGDAEAFWSYISDAYPVPDGGLIDEGVIRVTMPASHYGELPDKIVEVARRFDAAKADIVPRSHRA